MPKSPSPTRTINGLKTLDLENYLTYRVNAIANRLSRGASNVYRKEFGVGVVEWRCLVMLAMQEGVSAARIADVGGINKALVSRALARLEELGYVEDYHGSTTRKPRLLQFTRSGRALYQDMVEVALQREQTLRKGLSAAEQAELLRMLEVLFSNTEELDPIA